MISVSFPLISFLSFLYTLLTNGKSFLFFFSFFISLALISCAHEIWDKIHTGSGGIQNAKMAHVEWRPQHTSFKFLSDDIDML